MKIKKLREDGIFAISLLFIQILMFILAMAGVITDFEIILIPSIVFIFTIIFYAIYRYIRMMIILISIAIKSRMEQEKREQEV